MVLNQKKMKKMKKNKNKNKYKNNKDIVINLIFFNRIKVKENT